MTTYTFNNAAYEDLPKGSALVDGTDSLANAGLVIGFYHVPSKKTVNFKAFITSFNETYSPEWQSESVYGRADPIQMYKQTTRKITLAFKIPCSTHGEGYENLAKVQRLIQFLYPTYSEVNSATTITQSPLMRLRVMNLVSQITTGDITPGAPKDMFTAYKSLGGGEASSGLLGVVGNLTVNHNLENPEGGVLIPEGDTGQGNALIIPKLLEVNLDFTVIHEAHLGWQENDTFASGMFPYQAVLGDGHDAATSAAKQALLLNNAAADSRKKASQAAQQIAESAGGSFPSFGLLAAKDGRQSVVATDDKGNQFDLNAAAGDRAAATGRVEKEVDFVGSAEDQAEQGYTSEQNEANAAARYAGLFGSMRYNADYRDSIKGKSTDYQESALAGAEGDYSLSRRTQRAEKKN